MITLFEADGVTPLPNQAPTLTDITPATTQDFILRNTDAQARPVVSLRLWLEQEAGPATRSISVGGVAVTGTSEATATEVLTAPLPPGAELSGTQTWALPAGYDVTGSAGDGAWLRGLALPG